VLHEGAIPRWPTEPPHALPFSVQPSVEPRAYAIKGIKALSTIAFPSVQSPRSPKTRVHNKPNLLWPDPIRGMVAA
jgi:hypothetical protein